MPIYYLVLSLCLAGFGYIGCKVTRKGVTAILAICLAVFVNVLTQLMLRHYNTHLMTVPQQFELWGIVVVPWLFLIVGFAYGSIKTTKFTVVTAILVNALAIYDACQFVFALIRLSLRELPEYRTSRRHAWG